MGVNQTQHWTLANTGADLFYDVQFDGHPFTVIGVDGNPVWRTETATDLALPPGRRYDVLVQSTGREQPGGTYTLRTLRYRQGTTEGDTYPEVVLATVRFTGRVQQQRDALPAGLPGAHALDGTVTDRRTLYLNEDATTSNFAISDVPNAVQTTIPLAPVVVPRGQDSVTGEWTIANTTLEQHAFHQHIDAFQVIAASNPAAPCPNALEPVDAPSLQDVAVVPQVALTATPVQCAGDPAPTRTHFGRVVLRITWTDFFGTDANDPAGRIAVQCHVGAHLDNGMLTWFEVIKQ